MITWKYVVSCLFLLAAGSRAAEPASGPSSPPAAQTQSISEFEAFDSNGTLPEFKIPHAGPDDTRDILLTDGGFLAATGNGIFRYEIRGGEPKATARYVASDGLPSANCLSLRADATGGIWALCEGGVGYLPKGAENWRSFTHENGLAPGRVTAIELSPGKDRVWVTTAGGLATTSISDLKWKWFWAMGPVDIFVHPSKDIVWCSRFQSGRAMLDDSCITSQFDLASGIWKDIPYTSDGDGPLKQRPTHFDAMTNSLWITGSGGAFVYNMEANTTSKVGELAVGQMAQWADNDPNVLFATDQGLAKYDPCKKLWDPHYAVNYQECGEPLLAMTRDKKRVYWACDNSLAVWDAGTDRWTSLWDVEDKRVSVRQESLCLAPDERFVWWRRDDDIVVSDTVSKRAVVLTDANVAGLSEARSVCFDPAHELALITTRRGIVGCDYSGHVKFVVRPDPCPIVNWVEQFVFAPDGSEVWCLTIDNPHYGSPRPAIVFQPGRRSVCEVPNAGSRSGVLAVAFSPDSKRSWYSTRENGSEASVRERQQGGGERDAIGTETGRLDEAWAIRVSPKGDELWLCTGGTGVLRVKLDSNAVSQYVESDFRQVVRQRLPAAWDYADDVVFTPDQKYAFCSWFKGVALIDLISGTTTCSPVGSGDVNVNKIVMAPDGRTVWCILNNSRLWAFDIAKKDWALKLDANNGLPMTIFTGLKVVPDGNYVWLGGLGGVAVYSVAANKWKAFQGDEWKGGEGFGGQPLYIDAKGGRVVCGHKKGIALLTIDGQSGEVVRAPGATQGLTVSQIVPIPGSCECLCAISSSERSNIYRLNIAQKTLRLLRTMPSDPVTALAIAPDGYAWAAMPGEIISFDPATGRERDIKPPEPSSQASP